MKQLIMIKYGELTTKKSNRNQFINMLYQNIMDKLDHSKIKIIKNRIRMYIESDIEYVDQVLDILKNTFGIHGIVLVKRIDTNIDTIKNEVLDTLKTKTFKTFKIETKRSDKNYPILSTDVSKILGGFILDNMPDVSVDIHQPEIILKLEIRNDYAYIYHQEIKGLGGYPVGVAGKGLLMLSGGIDSPVAGYLALKRGINIETMYFESPPHTSMMAQNKVKTLVKILTKYKSSIKLHIVPFTKIQETIYQNINPTYMITIMRRMMYRIATRYAKKNKLLVLINGESVGQVASQTLSSMNVINSVTNMPIIRPVVCMDKLEIMELANKIGTYDTSILPYEDCCTIFLPKHPVINPKLEKCLLYEQGCNFDELIDECLNEVKTITIDSGDKSKFEHLL